MNDVSNYDVFISYSSTQREWTATLARNLKAAQRTVFFDEWSLIPGRAFVRELEGAIGRSRAAVVVASPEAQASGWVREELDTLTRRRIDDRTFSVVPVVHSGKRDDIDALPFIGNMHWVDFRQDYRSAFAQLLKALDDKPPGDAPNYDGPLETPPAGPASDAPLAPPQRTAMDKVLGTLSAASVVMVLTRGGVKAPDIVHSVDAWAREEWGQRVLPVALPYASDDGDEMGFLAEIARQIGLPPECGAPAEFQRAATAMFEDQPAVLVIGNFSHPQPKLLDAIAGIIKFLSERLGKEQFRAVLCGGASLHALKHEQGANSLLSMAKVAVWPAPDPAVALNGFAGSDSLSTAIVDASGGHPGIIEELVRAADEGLIRSADDARCAIASTAWVTQAADRHARSSEQQLRFETILQRQNLGAADIYHPSSIVRDLYWRGLVEPRQVGLRRILHWRSEAIRAALVEVVEWYRSAE